LKQGRLVGFDGEVVMGLLFFDQVLGQFSLGQQGIGGDVLVFEIEGLQERDGHGNLIGSLQFVAIAIDRQVPHFFGPQGGGESSPGGCGESLGCSPDTTSSPSD